MPVAAEDVTSGSSRAAELGAAELGGRGAGGQGGRRGWDGARARKRGTRSHSRVHTTSNISRAAASMSCFRLRSRQRSMYWNALAQGTPLDSLGEAELRNARKSTSTRTSPRVKPARSRRLAAFGPREPVRIAQPRMSGHEHVRRLVPTPAQRKRPAALDICKEDCRSARFSSRYKLKCTHGTQDATSAAHCTTQPLESARATPLV